MTREMQMIQALEKALVARIEVLENEVAKLKAKTTPSNLAKTLEGVKPKAQPKAKGKKR